MSQRLKEKECMLQLGRTLNLSIIDFYSSSRSMVFLINKEDRKKVSKNKLIIKDLSNQIKKYLHYLSFPCSIKRAIKQCLYPLEIVDFIVRKNNGKTTLYYLIDQSLKDSVTDEHSSNFRMSELLLQKHYAIDNIKIEGINPDFYFYYGKQMLSKVIG